MKPRVIRERNNARSAQYSTREEGVSLCSCKYLVQRALRPWRLRRLDLADVGASAKQGHETVEYLHRLIFGRDEGLHVGGVSVLEQERRRAEYASLSGVLVVSSDGLDERQGRSGPS